VSEHGFAAGRQEKEPEVVDMNETAVKQIEGRRTSRRSEVNGLYHASILFIHCIRLDKF